MLAREDDLHHRTVCAVTLGANLLDARLTHCQRFQFANGIVESDRIRTAWDAQESGDGGSLTEPEATESETRHFLDEHPCQAGQHQRREANGDPAEPDQRPQYASIE